MCSASSCAAGVECCQLPDSFECCTGGESCILYVEPGWACPESCHALGTQNRGFFTGSGAGSEVVIDFNGDLLMTPYE